MEVEGKWFNDIAGWASGWYCFIVYAGSRRSGFVDGKFISINTKTFRYSDFTDWSAGTFGEEVKAKEVPQDLVHGAIEELFEWDPK